MNDRIAAALAVIVVNSWLASLCLIVAVIFWANGEQETGNGLAYAVVCLVLSVIAAVVRYRKVAR